MKYKSELIKDIVDTRGHKKSSLHYESECVGAWIEETKGAYPKICDYESEWLNYINEKPLGKFPYETVTANPTATINNVVPYEYKSAILKGKTDENLQSVKMPVLKVTGKNLFRGEIERGSYHSTTTQKINSDNTRCRSSIIPLIPDGFKGNISISDGFQFYLRLFKGSNVVRESGFTRNYLLDNTSNTFSEMTIVIRKVDNTQFTDDELITVKIQIEEGTIATPYKPYQSNILTVNEDVTLRSNGSVYDELDLLTGKLTQRIDEDGSVLTQEIVKTVDLSIQDQDGNTLRKIKPIEGTMHITTSGTPINPTASLEVPVEAITQNLNSFKGEE